MELVGLPAEMLELIALYLPPSSIKALRCVSKKTNSSLDTKRVWSKLLFYPPRYYESDLQSGSPAAGVVEVVRGLAAGRLSRYHAYYQLQQLRLHQWNDDTLPNFKEITLPDLRNIKDMVNDDGQRWIFALDELCQKLYVWNITQTPSIHDIYELTHVSQKYTEPFHPLQHGYFLIKLCNRVIAVYKFMKPDYTLQLLYRFSFRDERVMETSAHIPLPPENEVEYFDKTVGDIFVAFDSHTTEDLSVHVWRVSSGVKLAKVGFPDGMFKKSASTIVSNVVDVSQGSSPNIGILFMGNIGIFNVDSCSFTHILAGAPMYSGPVSYELSLFMYADKLCFGTGINEVLVYRLSKSSTDLLLLRSFPYKFCCMLNHCKLLMFHDRRYHNCLIVNLNDDCLTGIPITMDPLAFPVSLIEPDLFVMVRRRDHTLNIMNTSSGVILHTWQMKRLDIDFPFWILLSYAGTLVYPTKFGLFCGTNTLRLYVL